MSEHVNVRNHRRSLVELPCGTRLLPGENAVAPERWQREGANRHTKALIEAGTLSVLDRPARPHPTEVTPEERSRASGRRADDISQFDVEQIKAIVADTDDVGLLEVWATDDRGEVQKLVKARIRSLKRTTR